MSAEAQAFLCPVGVDEAALVYPSVFDSEFARLGGTLLRGALSSLGVRGLPEGTSGRLFRTTELGEQLWDEARFHGSTADPGFRLPVALDSNAKFVKQIPLKEVDPSLLQVKIDPTQLMLMASTQVILQRLEAITVAIRAVGQQVSEVLHRGESAQKAKLRAAVEELDQFEALDVRTSFDWDMLKEYGTILKNLHHEFVQEIERIASCMRRASDPTQAWATPSDEEAARLSELVGLMVITVQALERWTLAYLWFQPDASSRQRTGRAMTHLEGKRNEAFKAIDGIPIQLKPERHRVRTMLAKGVLASNGELKKAQRNHQRVEPSVASSKRALTPLEKPQRTRLQILPADDEGVGRELECA